VPTGELPGWQNAVREVVERLAPLLPPLESDADARRLKHFKWMATSQRRFGLERTSPIPSILAHVGNYWCSGILLILQPGALRPSLMLKILAAMEPSHPISQRMLTLNLRELERDGLIERNIRLSGRAHVEYQLTRPGEELSRILATLIDWGVDNVPSITAAREDFDLQARPAPLFGSVSSTEHD
jgi:DNA-binding HxlR family transcriptional regulator